MSEDSDDELFQDHLFDSTIAYDRSPKALAAYIEAGGDLDEGLRKHLASMIRRYFPKPRGGTDPRGDIEFYEFVRDWCIFEPIRRVACELRKRSGDDPSAEEVISAMPVLSKKLRNEDGLRHVINTGAFGLTPDTEINSLRKKYNRGKKLASGTK